MASALRSSDATEALSAKGYPPSVKGKVWQRRLRPRKDASRSGGLRSTYAWSTSLLVAHIIKSQSDQRCEMPIDRVVDHSEYWSTIQNIGRPLINALIANVRPRRLRPRSSIDQPAGYWSTISSKFLRPRRPTHVHWSTTVDIRWSTNLLNMGRPENAEGKLPILET